ncbi:suppressor of fused domain protein [Nocardia xishanensis]|uniref:suppressor of fused domain protein n=1 Tax=Nocardia xishanensis TaxID=238964 RepID=UPI00082A6370|nr:suppressor of fused domain protein [Nocardia xishanensis]
MSVGPGRDAIDDVLAQLYGELQPVHWTVGHPWSLGGPDPLEGVSAYPRTDPVPHWHYIGYGMSELGQKEWDDPAVSGWGFEFTFRLAGDPGAAQAPIWPAHFLQDLARYVFQSGKWFEPGHTIKANGPLAADRPDSALEAVGFVTDPELGAIATPNGRVTFLQIVGLTMTEYQAALGGKLLALLDGLAPRLPLFVTDIDRESLVAAPKPQAQWPRWGGGLRGRA